MGKKIIIGIAVLILVVVVTTLFSKSKASGRVTEIKEISYEELCRKNGDMWMEMEPWINGERISDEKCYGCMIGENHFCDKDKYIEYIKKLKE